MVRLVRRKEGDLPQGRSRRRTGKSDQAGPVAPGKTREDQIAGGSGCGLNPKISIGLTQTLMAATPPATLFSSSSCRMLSEMIRDSIDFAPVLLATALSPSAVGRRLDLPGSCA